MASETREVIVTVRAENADGKGKKDIVSVKPKPIAEKRSKLGEFMDTAVFHNVCEQVASQSIEASKYAVNRAFSLKDDYVGQRNAQVAYSLAKKSMNIGMQTYYGAKFGGMPGAILAFTASIALEGLSAGISLDRQNIRISQMEAQLGFDRFRSGYALTSDSIGEDR